MRRRPKRAELLPVAWRHGDRAEKRIVLLIRAAPLVAAILFAVLLTYGLLNRIPALEYVLAGLAVGFATVSWFFYSYAIWRPLYSARVMLAALELDVWSQDERDSLAKTARHRETYGVDGRIPGEVGYGYAYASVYYASCVASLVVSLALYPRLWILAPVLSMFADTLLGGACIALFARGLKQRLKDPGGCPRALHPRFTPKQ